MVESMSEQSKRPANNFGHKLKLSRITLQLPGQHQMGRHVLLSSELRNQWSTMKRLQCFGDNINFMCVLFSLHRNCESRFYGQEIL